MLSKIESEDLLQKSWEDISKGVPKTRVPYIGLESRYNITLVVYDALMSSDQNKLNRVNQYLNEKIRKIRGYKLNANASIRRRMALHEMIVIKRIFDRARDETGLYKVPCIFESEKNIDELESSIVKIIKSGDVEKAEQFCEYLGELSLDEFTRRKTGFNFSDLCAYESVLFGFINAIRKAK